ncbi:Fe(3+) ABC transporter substrate-binding protein [Arenibaculum pallidiluteum]|uniref:Fe(3+) ABC transporter substrate-binding protein n=1 Tax=Arenibaculum pallidiluteum TaxID=2812559 RepID=UPI001A96BD90|nr:Fe(3+) ABC transporter substrate-binding protein [Arenibaculum pallidiluteum]
MSLRARGLAALLGLTVGGLASVASAAEVNVYSARHYDTDRALYDTFARNTGIKVNLIEGGEDQLIERMRNEGANSPADVLITVDAGRLWRARDAGLLQPTKSAVIEEKVPAHLRDPEGYWTGVAKRARVIIYNKDKVQPSEITSYEGLADPKWKGRLLIRSSTNVYNQSLVGSMLAAHGEKKTEDWARGIVANLARPPQGGDTDQIKAVAAGEGDVAVSNTYYLARLLNSSKPEEKALGQKLGVVFPNQGDRGTHVNISGAGVAKSAPNRENAIKFIEYLVSPEAQKMFAGRSFEYPVVKGVEADATIASWGEFKEDQLNASIYGRNNAEALKITDRAGWK